jgi:hypothetical protein
VHVFYFCHVCFLNKEKRLNIYLYLSLSLSLFCFFSLSILPITIKRTTKALLIILLLLICRFKEKEDEMQSPNMFAPTGEREHSRSSLDAHARRTEPNDAKKAKNLVQSYTLDVFGRVNREENISSIL